MAMTNRRTFGIVIGVSVNVVLIVLILATAAVLRSGHAVTEARLATDRTANLLAIRDADNAQARVSSCNQFNAQQTNNRAALKGLIRVSFAQAPNPNDPRVLKYLTDFDGAADRNYPYRDCSPSGVAAYFANPPAPVNCDPDGKGFCK